MDVSNKPLPEPMVADKAWGASRLRADGLWAFDSRAGGCEVGRLESRVGLLACSCLVESCDGVGHNQELTTDCSDAIGSRGWG